MWRSQTKSICEDAVFSQVSFFGGLVGGGWVGGGVLKVRMSHLVYQGTGMQDVQ